MPPQAPHAIRTVFALVSGDARKVLLGLGRCELRDNALAQAKEHLSGEGYCTVV